jgi:hypothetical protein
MACVRMRARKKVELYLRLERRMGQSLSADRMRPDVRQLHYGANPDHASR